MLTIWFLCLNLLLNNQSNNIDMGLETFVSVGMAFTDTYIEHCSCTMCGSLEASINPYSIRTVSYISLISVTFES
jgi:hypothetical protein